MLQQAMIYSEKGFPPEFDLPDISKGSFLAAIQMHELNSGSAFNSTEQFELFTDSSVPDLGQIVDPERFLILDQQGRLLHGDQRRRVEPLPEQKTISLSAEHRDPVIAATLGNPELIQVSVIGDITR